MNEYFILAEAQYGFRANRSIVDLIFALGNWQKNMKNLEKSYMSVTSTSERHSITFGEKDFGKQ